uniref:DUF834 domain-containing protein n=1 Tax=Oryza punctata TaxID=4537 RepID=A0A0E0M5Y5_ORYPU
MTPLLDCPLHHRICVGSGHPEHRREGSGTERRRGSAGSGCPLAPMAGGKGRQEEVVGGLPTPPPLVEEVDEEVRGKGRKRRGKGESENEGWGEARQKIRMKKSSLY